MALVDIQRDKLVDVRNKTIENGGDAAVHVANMTDIDSVKPLENEIVLDHGIPDIAIFRTF